MKRLLPLAILGVAVLIAVAIVNSKPKAKPVQIKEKAWRVSVQKAEPRTYSPMLTLYGRIESLWSSQLTAGITADVKVVDVLEGDDVTKGQVLLKLDDRDARLMLAQREAELAEVAAKIDAEKTRYQADTESLQREQRLSELSQAELKRITDLIEKKLASHSAVDSARQEVQRKALTVRAREQSIQSHNARLAELKAKLHRAEALRDQARLDLERTRVVSPFNGRIAKVLVSPGKRVRSGDALIQLYDTSAMVVRAQLPSRYVGEVRKAQNQGKVMKIKGSVDGDRLQATLLRIAGEANNSSGGIEALFAISDGNQFQQGRFVRIDLSLPARDGLIALSPEAVYGADRIYLVDADKRIHPKRVQRIGEIRDRQQRSKVLIAASGIKPGDTIVTTQLPNAIEGLLVEVSQPTAAEKTQMIAKPEGDN